jgi:hypothetical protein
MMPTVDRRHGAPAFLLTQHSELLRAQITPVRRSILEQPVEGAVPELG